MNIFDQKRQVIYLLCIIILAITTEKVIAKGNAGKHCFTLLDAHYENINSGVPGGKSSKEYYFKIKIVTNDKIVFDSFWIHNKSFKTYLANNRKSVSSVPTFFSKNDTIVLRVSEQTLQSIEVPVPPPIAYKGAGLLKYFVNEKPGYRVIGTIQFITGQNRP